jgi:hypothetical protein
LIPELLKTLRCVQKRRTGDFSGVGVIVCDTPEVLPIVPLLQTTDLPSQGDLISDLASISSWQSEFHDGFHVVSSSWRLTRTAQYFSPPMAPGAVIDRSKRFGGRYLAALFGSAIPGVMISAVASDGFGIAIFREGKEVMFEAHK